MPTIYHIRKSDSQTAACEDVKDGDVVVDENEVLDPDKNWFNCPKCFEALWGNEVRQRRSQYEQH